MKKSTATKQAQAAIEKARRGPAPAAAGWWFDSFDRRGRPCRMFVPAA